MKLNNLRFLLVICLLIAVTSVLPAQTVIRVAAGADVISGAMKTAAAGSIIELTTSGGVYAETGDILVTKDITVRAAAGLASKPVLYCGGSNTFYVTGGGLNVSGIKFDDPAQLLYFISVKSDTVNTSTNFSLRVDNCDFFNCGQRCIYTSDGTMRPLDSILVTNSRFFDNVKQIIYEKGIRNTPTNKTQPGGAKYIKMENCLIVGTSSTSDGWATYIEPANRDSASYKWPTVFINHLTVDSMALGGINTYTTPGAVIQNCIVINSKDTARYAFGAETGRFAGAPRSSIKNVIYNAFPNRFVTYGSSSSPGYAYPDTAKIFRATPTFVNAANRDYTLAAGSVGKGAGTDGRDIGYVPSGLGGTSAPTIIRVAAGADVISGAMKTAAAGSIIELTTSGGVYAETGDILVTKDITVRAAAGLASKPVLYCGGSNTFYVTGGGLNVSGIKFDDPAQLLYFISVKSDTVNTSTNFSLRVDNCDFFNCGQRCIYTSDGTMRPLDSILVTNSRFFDNVKQIIYEKGIRNTPTNKTQPGGAKYIKMENCLIVGTSSTSDGWATYIEPANRDSASYKWPTVFINHLTVDSMALGGINTYTTPGAVIQNCIVINSKDTARYAFGAETGRFAGAPRSSIKNVIYNAFPNRFVTYGSSSSPGYAYPDTAKIFRATPTFVNAANRDYTLAAGSVGKGAGTDGRDIGYVPSGLATDVETYSDQVPASFQLSQNYPNPFNPATTIQFSISKAGTYSINVFNVLGQRVVNLFEKAMVPGNYSVRFDGAHLSSGMYIYTLTGDGVNISRKMALLK